MAFATKNIIFPQQELTSVKRLREAVAREGTEANLRCQECGAKMKASADGRTATCPKCGNTQECKASAEAHTKRR